MTRRARIGQVIALVFALANLAVAGFVAGQREWLHGGAHLALALVGACVAWWLTARARRDAFDVAPADGRVERIAHLEHLQQSVDAIALEVERIGEAQRFTTKLQAEQVRTPH